MSRSSGPGWLGRSDGWVAPVVAVAVRPRLWPTALGQVGRLAPSGWWRRWPPVPRPDPAYLRFRLQTAYGDPARAPAPDDVVAYLLWCRRMGRMRRLRYPSQP